MSYRYILGVVFSHQPVVISLASRLLSTSATMTYSPESGYRQLPLHMAQRVSSELLFPTRHLQSLAYLGHSRRPFQHAVPYPLSWCSGTQPVRPLAWLQRYLRLASRANLDHYFTRFLPNDWSIGYRSRTETSKTRRGWSKSPGKAAKQINKPHYR
ncbi:hypothetical protein BJ508DRAFT_152593 [Ascobolus immersus RN42]|uniref:Uncharacterized protein n=1 Tax=Ascobolus immersus RN42 TaxID=1160509 RepID=A0A3N4I001_ASCIM|nr:hypothetical protein BJ508DRAFT_152593 [Ascobolus immersus RN42]